MTRPEIACRRVLSATRSVIATALVRKMYSAGNTGYPIARYGRGSFGRFARRMKRPIVVSA